MAKNIINNSNLLSEVRRIVKEEIRKENPRGQLDSLWKFLNKLSERVKCLEK